MDASLLIKSYILAKNSPDISTQNGAILIRGDPLGYAILGAGFNTFPTGVKITPERLKRPEKYDFTGHAERRAIFDAINKGNNVKGTTLYVPWFACSACADAIINLGIKEVVGWTGLEKMAKETSKGEGQPEWQISINHALEMFDEAGVKYRWFDGHLDIDTEILFSGKKFNISKVI